MVIIDVCVCVRKFKLYIFKEKKVKLIKRIVFFIILFSKFVLGYLGFVFVGFVLFLFAF